jgi:hypothetical protein
LNARALCNDAVLFGVCIKERTEQRSILAAAIEFEITTAIAASPGGGQRNPQRAAIELAIM